MAIDKGTPAVAARNADGINEEELARAVEQSKREHEHGHHHHDHGDFHDYTQAVREYKKTFANKQQVIEQTPDPAVRDMLLRMQELGIDTVFDRFDAQQPQCSFGIAGICCKNCFMGPCKITKKAPRGAFLVILQGPIKQFLQQMPAMPNEHCGCWASKRSKTVSMPSSCMRRSISRTAGSGVCSITCCLFAKVFLYSRTAWV